MATPFLFRIVATLPELPEEIVGLKELVYNTWFSWHPRALDLFNRLDPVLWREVNHNPVKFLLQARRSVLEAAAMDEEFLDLYRQVMAEFVAETSKEGWYHRRFPEQQNLLVAYFSAEFGIHECFPTYSGGLGLLAGDHCKAASDLGVPMVGVGILYKHGYFTQRIDRYGRQEALYPYVNFHELPIKPALLPDGSQLKVAVELPGRTLWVRVWEMKLGRVRLFFLDADLPQNAPADRELTGQLYGGDRDTRISQEIILGIGGVRALRALQVHPTVWHINEGHAAFLCLERLREMVENGIDVNVAREVIRANTLFTTHTPVPAGHDVFSVEMIDRYFGPYYGRFGMNRDEFIAQGWDNVRQGFNMTVLAMRYAGWCNAVSRLHRDVTRRMFASLFPGVPQEEIPIFHITNGVHTETWLAAELRELFDAYFPSNWLERVTDPTLWQEIDRISDAELWEVHNKLKRKAIGIIRDNIRNRRKRNHDSPQRIKEVRSYLDPNVLTIGFARRFAVYKRADLLFRDPERLDRIINHPEHPVQFVFAGKAHPADKGGQEIIQRIWQFSQDERFAGKIIFCEDYDIKLARALIQGVDVWLNMPRRPLEASGTSGQKAVLNGVLHCSILDGWWPEAYRDGNVRNGFAVGEEREYPSEEVQDENDALALYAVLEEDIAPLYYQREDGLPRQWIKMIKEAYKTIVPYFNTRRMVQEYLATFYLPAHNRGLAFTEKHYEAARRLYAYKRFISENWHHVAVMAVEENGSARINAGELVVEALVQLGPIWYRDVVVEIVTGNVGGEGLYDLETYPMKMIKEVDGGRYHYQGSVPLKQGSFGYTVRVRPTSTDFAYPFELPLVTWAQSL